MGTSSWLATFLDWEMLLKRQTRIAPVNAFEEELDQKSGGEVAHELGGRYLLRYLLPQQVGLFIQGSIAKHYVTPTPYAPEETIAYLALPHPTQPHPYVLVLDPAQIVHIWGPQWIRGGMGIQYILPNGFPQEAIVVPGTPGAAWEIQIR